MHIRESYLAGGSDKIVLEQEDIEAIKSAVLVAVGDTLAQASKRLYRKKELAALLGVSQRTVSEWVRKDGLPQLKVGQMCFYDIDDVVDFIKSQN